MVAGGEEVWTMFSSHSSTSTTTTINAQSKCGSLTASTMFVFLSAALGKSVIT